MVARAGGTYLVKADISHFYPSLYTHAVGWAVDPKLRSRDQLAEPEAVGQAARSGFDESAREGKSGRTDRK